VLFADGAGAVVLTPSAEPGIISTRLHSDGKYKDLLLYPDGVSKGFHLVREGKAGVQMKGNEVYKVASTRWDTWSPRRSAPTESAGINSIG